MGIGRGRFRKALRAVLLSQHATPNVESLVRKELGWNCVYCGVSGEVERLQLDHLWPEAEGGCLVIGNVVPACPTCNSDRRETPWQQFLRSSERVRTRRDAEQVARQIDTIIDYMKRHDQVRKPELDQVLSPEEHTLLADFDLLLSAISDGALARTGYKKKSSVKFNEPCQMFNELVSVAKSFQKDSS